MDLLLHKAIFHCGQRYICSKYLLIITLRYINEWHTSTIVLISRRCMGSAFLDKMVTWGKSNMRRLLVPHA